MKVISKPIEMVAWFEKDGSIHPVKFRYENEDNSLSVVTINKILLTQNEKLAGNNMLVYRCQSLINGAQKIFEVKYEFNTAKWILYKI